MEETELLRAPLNKTGVLQDSNPGHGDVVLPFSKICSVPLTEEALGKLGRSLASAYLRTPSCWERLISDMLLKGA